ncbi:DUF4403 family protein [Reinekea marinisedimentorum]|uniref:Uncharacterized protein DUF4403 n=1 Tax=Reinekea marinisedimentorum TaxID=230495 RepID=A0A4R3I7Z3_9GAMM|nr:DUF4403 family protein [Reinekea marinisedimentorum]TCS42363.1 uncharacterized protein DUF4403 [Reinekea marinisedimentorum]
MKKSAYLAAWLVLFCTQTASAQSMADKLIVKVLNKHMPAVLYEHANQQWDLGVYSLRIDRVGIPSFSSSETQLKLSFPIEAHITGKVEQQLFGNTLVVNCNNSFATDSHIDITPTLSNESSTVKVSMLVPIPETYLNCDGLRVPMKAMLEKLIAEKKAEWEAELETELNGLFKEMEI